jgi:hypothetical protein
MVHSTPARKEAKELKQIAIDLSREIKALENIEGAAQTGRRRAGRSGQAAGSGQGAEGRSQAERCPGVWGLHCQADQKGREEIWALDGRLARRQQDPQGLLGELQEAEPRGGHAEG